MKYHRLYRRRSHIAVAAAIIAAAVGVAGASTASAASSRAHKSLGTLTVAVAVTNAVFSQPFIAQTEGFFKRAGLTVNLITNAGSLVGNDVASGQAQLGMVGIATPMLLSLQGKPTTIVYSHAAGASGGVLASAPNVTSIAQLQGQKIGTLGIGTSGYGFAEIYDHRYHLNADIVPFSTPATLTAALASGQIAGATGAYDYFGALIGAGQAHLLLDTRTQAERTAKHIPDYPEGGIFGLTSTVKAHHTQIVAYLWALNQALRWIHNHTLNQVAGALSSNPAFATQTVQVLKDSVHWDLGYVAPTGGAISAKVWPKALGFYAQWGVPGFNAASPTVSYKQAVNMSYLDTALEYNQGFRLYPKCKKGHKSTTTHPCRS